ncbi:hypothetical protein PPTG_23974 [Phytophthora nicotianae INRA-310]|uniref:Uncharacterized protein n=1 Tax=Phytophthora nicotianae (strain INRA-310) TaxID=761204 RepID=W2PLZ4_PHYN3|nr:hypothetical protein PPTG_23974 [Phytophthora nicotianae INRA-310]ETN01867.1 hypothetical protein PPTG_23974 [Phytophthora nicotianae INRA-310]
MAPSEASGYFSWTQRVSFAGGFSRTIANFYIRICHRVRCGFSTSDQGVLIADYHYNPVAAAILDLGLLSLPSAASRLPLTWGRRLRVIYVVLDNNCTQVLVSVEAASRLGATAMSQAGTVVV